MDMYTFKKFIKKITFYTEIKNFFNPDRSLEHNSEDLDSTLRSSRSEKVEFSKPIISKTDSNKIKNEINEIKDFLQNEIKDILQNKMEDFLQNKIKNQLSKRIIDLINDFVKKLNTNKFKDYDQLKIYLYLYLIDSKKALKFFVKQGFNLLKIDYVLLALAVMSIGAFRIIPSRYKDLTIIYRSNLTALSYNQNEISWQTFKDFKFNHSTNLLEDINKIQIYDNDIYIEPSLHYHTKNNRYFIGIFKDNEINENLEDRSLEPNLENLDSRLRSSRFSGSSNYKIVPKPISEMYRDFYYLLDEFPLKLDNDFIEIKRFLFDKENIARSLEYNLSLENKSSRSSRKQPTKKKKRIVLIENLKKYRKLKRNKILNNLNEQKTFKNKSNFSLFSLIKTREIKEDKLFNFRKFWFIKLEKKVFFLETNKKKLLLSTNYAKKEEIIQTSENLNKSNSFKIFKEKKFLLERIYKFYFYEKNINVFNIESYKDFFDLVNSLALQENEEFLINSYDLEDPNLNQNLYEEYEDYDLESLILELNKNNSLINNEKNIYLRKMSGFNYPDFNIKKVKSYLIGNLLNKNNFLYPSLIRINRINNRFLHPASFDTELLLNNNRPNLEFFYKDTYVLDSEKANVIFEGPAIKFDKDFTDIIILNSKLTKDWMKSFVNFENPFSDKYKTCFGRMNVPKDNIFFTTEFLNEIVEGKKVIEEDLNLKNYQSNTNEVAKKKIPKESTLKVKKYLKYIKRTSNSEFIPQNVEDRVPFLKKKQWIKLYEIVKEAYDVELVDILPLVNISYPRQKPIILPLMQFEYSNSLNDYKFPFNYILHQPKKNFVENNYFEPYSQYKLNYDYYELRKTGSNTRRIASIYPKKNKIKKKNKKSPFSFLFKKGRSTFYQSWEPLTLNSWLFLTQYSFLRLALDLLRGVYNNYGKEFASYCIDVAADLGSSDDFSDIGNDRGLNARAESLKKDLDLIEEEKSYRIIYKNKTKFKEIIGIKKILPELSEFVWNLRALKSKTNFFSLNLGVGLPKGLLLIGDPGTGKTLIAKAIAGESGVPVIVQSGSTLIDYEKRAGEGRDRLEELFYRAKQIAPCIIFIDEIDSLGQKRDNVISTRFIGEPILEALYDFYPTEEHLETSFDAAKLRFQKNKNIDDLDAKPVNPDDEKLYEYIEDTDVTKQKVELYNSLYDASQNVQKKVNLMVKFLIELDGLRGRKGIVVIAATNRPDSLDPALLRPGRFDQILEIQLPDKDSRIEILKLYTQKLGIIFKTSDSWDYLSNLTLGFSAADIAAIANESALKSIINDSIHSLESIEEGILYIIGFPEEKILNKTKKFKDPYVLNRFAFYQAGKAVLHNNLYNHPKVVQLTLIPKTLNARFTEIHKSELLSTTHSKNTLQNRVIGFYAGKAAEVLSVSTWPIKNNSILKKNNKATSRDFKNNRKKDLKFLKSSQSNFWISNIGYDDIYSGNSLAYMLIDHWFFYSKGIPLTKFFKTDIPDHEDEYIEMELIEFYKLMAKETEKYIADELFIDPDSNLKINAYLKISSWWHVQMLKSISLNETELYGDWYRLYLPDPEESEFNLEYVPPDEHFQNNNKDDIFENFKNTISWNDLHSIKTDYLFNALILCSFNKAFWVLDRNREYLDFLAYFLMKYQIIRQTDLENFNRNFWKKNQKISKNKKKLNKVFIVDSSWGVNSIRKTSRFLNMDQISYVSKEEKYKKWKVFEKK